MEKYLMITVFALTNGDKHENSYPSFHEAWEAARGIQIVHEEILGQETSIIILSKRQVELVSTICNYVTGRGWENIPSSDEVKLIERE